MDVVTLVLLQLRAVHIYILSVWQYYRDKTMANKLMYISIDTQNYPFCGLQLVLETLNVMNQPLKI